MLQRVTTSLKVRNAAQSAAKAQNPTAADCCAAPKTLELSGNKIVLQAAPAASSPAYFCLRNTTAENRLLQTAARNTKDH
jgi:hypothetical protein